MKLLIASDIHGSAYYCRMLLEALEREKNMQKAMLDIKKKYGKNAILKGMNLLEGATAKDRNEQIGGHKA